MTIRFHALDGMNELPSGRLDAAVAALETAAVIVGPLLPVEHVDVVVTPVERSVPGWDVSGFAHGKGRITIGLSTARTLLADRESSIDLAPEAAVRPLAEQLRAVLAHELHHVARARGPGYGRTLGEALVSEGLAQCFEEEAGCPTPNYAMAVRGDALGLLALRARREWDGFYYDHSRWFFGDRQDPTWPWSGGYSLGYVLVRHYLEESGRLASEAAQVAARNVQAASEQCLAELIAAADDTEAG